MTGMEEHTQHHSDDPRSIETVIVGGGQAGLSVGYHLARAGRPFVILDANERIGDAWRKRWDSLLLFYSRPLQRPPRDVLSRAAR